MTDIALSDRLRAPGITALGVLREMELQTAWREDVEAYRTLVKALISESCAAEAFELACDGLSRHKGDRYLEYLRALALDRGGNPRLASEYIVELLHHDLRGSLLVDALSLAGKSEKRKSQQAADGERRRECASASAAWYERAYVLTADYYPGINAAAMRLLTGDKAGAEKRARELLSAVENTDPGSHDFWLLATLGEAHLIAGNRPEALHWYRLAVAGAFGRTGDLGSMRFDLRMLGSELEVDPELLGLFDIGRVVAFAGHMIDRPDRARPRFPADRTLVARVGLAIDEAIVTFDARIGYSSVASGSDILFAKAMIARGREMHVIVPFALQDFYGTSVEYGQVGAQEWRADCDYVLARAQVHYATREPFLNDDALWDFSSLFTQGLAITRAAAMEAEACALVVLDSAVSRTQGGTLSFLETWGARPAQVLDLAALRGGAESPAAVSATNLIVGESRRRVKAMLFADVKNFSRLEEEKADAFFSVFPQEVAALLKTSAPTDFKNTWGDGLFLVFDRVSDCAEVALRLVERMEALDFEKLGLPADTTVRVGVHAGPVFSGHDPILGRINFFGSHVNRAARIEPVTTPGCVFASEQFAALLAVEASAHFVCEYMGVKTLPKAFDRCALYRLGRR